MDDLPHRKYETRSGVRKMLSQIEENEGAESIGLRLRPRPNVPEQNQPPKRTKSSPKKRRRSPSEKDDLPSTPEGSSDILPEVFSPALTAGTPPSSPPDQVRPTTSPDGSKDASLEPHKSIISPRGKRKIDSDGYSDIFGRMGSPAVMSNISPSEPPVQERRRTSSDDSREGLPEDHETEKSLGKKRKRSGRPAERESLLGPFEQYLDRSTREEMRDEALALQEEKGEELGPLEKMNIWLSRSSLLQPRWPQLQDAESSIKKMRRECLDPNKVRYRQEKADEEERQKEEKRLANKAKYGLGRGGNGNGGGHGGFSG